MVVAGLARRLARFLIRQLESGPLICAALLIVAFGDNLPGVFVAVFFAAIDWNKVRNCRG